MNAKKTIYIVFLGALCLVSSMLINVVESNANQQVDCTDEYDINIENEFQCNFLEETLDMNHVKYEYVEVNLQHDSKVCLDVYSASTWGIDTDRSSEGIYIENSEVFFLSKGIHRFYLMQAEGGRGNITVRIKIFPICKIYANWKGEMNYIGEYSMIPYQNYGSYGNYDLLPEFEKEGYIFQGWYEDKEYNIPVEKLDKTKGKDWVLYPKLEPCQYNIVYNLNGGVNSSLNPASISVEDGKIILEEPVKEGYEFKSWYLLSDNGIKTYLWQDKLNIREMLEDKQELENIELYADWGKKKYSIKYKLNGGKNFWRNPEAYYFDDGIIALYAPTRKHYKFDGWYLDKNFEEKVTSINSEEKRQITLYAKWVEVEQTNVIFSNKKETFSFGTTRRIYLRGYRSENSKIHWKSSDESVVKVINDKGKYIICEIVGIGNATIYGNVDGRYTIQCDVTARKPRLIKSEITIRVGEKADIDFKGYISSFLFQWKSENSNIARVNRLNEIIGVSEGKTYIIIRIKKHNYVCRCLVNVVK